MSATITNSTFSGNSVSTGAHGAAIYNAREGISATVTIGSTIVDQAGASGENIYNNGSVVTSNGYNLSSDAGVTNVNGGTGSFNAMMGDQTNTDPMLGALQDNGGPTFTRALLPNSPAIDKGKNFSGSSTDQRGSGFARTYDDPAIANATGGDGTDIGAFEVQAAPTSTPTPTPAYAAQVQQPINVDGTSVFNVRRGVIPVKFTLTLEGVPTCDLPAGTIAVTRTAGGTVGPVDESTYGGPADTGSNFRIDSCQYIYNLSASALGVGTYRVDISIDGQVVGSAGFGLR